MSVRNFKDAATNFLDTVSTFTSYELMTYHTFIKYTITSAMLTLDRQDLTKKVRARREVWGEERLSALRARTKKSVFVEKLQISRCNLP